MPHRAATQDNGLFAIIETRVLYNRTSSHHHNVLLRARVISKKGGLLGKDALMHFPRLYSTLLRFHKKKNIERSSHRKFLGVPKRVGRSLLHFLIEM